MTAKEMFEGLEYEQMSGYTGLMYKKESIVNLPFVGEKNKETWVHFVNNTVTVSKYLIFGGNDSEEIDMPLLKAINKQIEELGWLDEN